MWSDLQDALGRPVFEIPTLPPSVPGMRVFETFARACARAAARIVLNSSAVLAARDGTRVEAVRATPPGREVDYRARWIVLATGGVAGGGIALDSHWRARETALGLPLPGVPAAGEPRFGADYFGEHPFARAGVAVDDGLRPVGGEACASWTTCSWPARRWPARSPGRRSRATASAWRAGTARPS